jgi:hypothetical protein
MRLPKDIHAPLISRFKLMAGMNIAERSVMQLTYYWRADAKLDRDLPATTLFFDAHGHVESLDGFPAWSQTRTIGQGVRVASTGGREARAESYRARAADIVAG